MQLNNPLRNHRLDKITRFSITFPPELLEEFDEIIGKMGYDSRSKAMQDAVQLFVTEKKWVQQDDSIQQTGIILMIYNHDTRGLEADLTESQHHHKSLVTSTLHIHISDTDCLEVIAVKGKASEIRHLSDELATRRGVKILKTIMATT
jgi:CopG family transcriptional regulator, nickel-responsive regulator